MVKRKREGDEGPEGQLVVSTSTNRSVTGLLSLTDHLLWCILEWSRPGDEDLSIWIWLCRVGATCKVFRRLLRMEKENVPRLLPTVFKLAPYIEYTRCQRTSADLVSVSISAALMETIRNSDWMGLNIRRVIACNRYGFIRAESAIGRGLRQFLTSQCLPKLTEIYINTDMADRNDNAAFFPVDHDFLPRIAALYPGLTKLSLYSCFDSDVRQGLIIPESFTSLSSFCRLQHFGIQLCNMRCTTFGWVGNEHLEAICSSLNPNLTSLVLKIGYNSQGLTNDGFTSIATRIEKLDTFFLRSDSISTSEIINIIRANKSITKIHLNHAAHNDSIIDAIIAERLRLTTFRATVGLWINDDTILKLLKGQIEAFGKVHLTTIGIAFSSVTPAGLRAFLKEWKQTNPVFPLRVEMVLDRVSIRPIVDEFPEVEFCDEIATEE